jgi:endonuclease/exonuclease/phosphatase family metal-dependent hydrolase
MVWIFSDNMKLINRRTCYILLFSAVFFSTAVVAESPVLRVITYNIRYENQADTGTISWSNRKPFILSTILFHQADIIGMQEVLHSQLVYFDSALNNFSHAGVGREDGKEKGEYAPIYFNKNVFDLLQDSTFWLSSTPEIVSKGWDAALERICTWLKIKDKRNGKIFFVFNTHFDHQGIQAREESAKLLLQQMHRIAGELPVILTGDFNTPEKTKPIESITGKNSKNTYFLYDAMYRSDLPHHGSYTTFCGFNVLKGIIGDRIDYIFTSRHFSILNHATLTDFKEGHFPSDHFPVFSTLKLK